MIFAKSDDHPPPELRYPLNAKSDKKEEIWPLSQNNVYQEKSDIRDISNQ
jgi:hypothetical protein